MKKIFILSLLISFLTIGISAQYQVIVHKSNTATTITKGEVASYFLKKKKKWASGQKVVPVDQRSNSAVRKAFSSAVVGKSVGAMKSYWQQAVFSGRGTPPVEKASDQDVINFVKSNPGSIGYVSSGANVSSVKVIKIN